MKKIWGWIIGVALVIAIGFYIIWNNSNAAPMVATTGTTNTNTDDNAAGSMPGMDMASGTSMATGTMGTGGTGAGNTGTTGQYKDGTYTGPVTDAVYGQLEVVATIKGGMIVDTECPIQPNAPGHTTEVNQAALPQLKQEAIATQSANVNIISGATQTSEAYQQSLAAALAQAKS